MVNVEIKKERVITCKAFLVMVCQHSMVMVNRHSMAMLVQIVTMDDSAVSFHTPKTKQQSKQWLEKGQPSQSPG